MVNQVANNQLLTPPLINTIEQLSTSLRSIQPSSSETTQLITYALIATAVVGIFVYHYIKSHEEN